MKNKQSGFSLVEILIVIVILGIIIAIAVPNMIAARRAANEGSAIASMRTLNGAQATYYSSFGAGNYAGSVATNGDTVGLGSLNSNNLIDSLLGNGSKSGYKFVGAITPATASEAGTFFFSANPISASGFTQTGTRRFAVTQIGTIVFDFSNLATPFTQATAQTATPVNN